MQHYQNNLEQNKFQLILAILLLLLLFDLL